MVALPSTPDTAVLSPKEGGASPEAPPPPVGPRIESSKPSELEEVTSLRKRLGLPEESSVLKQREVIAREKSKS